MSAQKAFNVIGDLLDERYQRWDITEGRVPSWGGETDRQATEYIEGIKNVVRANLYWR